MSWDIRLSSGFDAGSRRVCRTCHKPTGSNRKYCNLCHGNAVSDKRERREAKKMLAEKSMPVNE